MVKIVKKDIKKDFIDFSVWFRFYVFNIGYFFVETVLVVFDFVSKAIVVVIGNNVLLNYFFVYFVYFRRKIDCIQDKEAINFRKGRYFWYGICSFCFWATTFIFQHFNRIYNHNFYEDFIDNVNFFIVCQVDNINVHYEMIKKNQSRN